MRVRLAAGVIGLASLAGVTPATAQVSPGPLSRSHSELEGALNCFQCHGSGRGSVQGKCQECHEEIRWLVDNKRGLHGQAGLGDCVSCHPEHAGADFELIEWKEGSAARFDHGRSGWPLLGKHRGLECSRCHAPRYMKSPAARLGPDPGREGRWTGLDTGCDSCHEDIHAGALGRDCLACHGQEGWKPADSFDHGKTDFPLNGRHSTVKCDACHRAEHLPLERDGQGRAIPVFKPLPHRECSDCHKDPHESRLGAACARCHDTADWRSVPEERIDHARTRFPLRGAHGRVPCARCHDAEKAWGRRPRHDTCATCHADVHAGQATLGGRQVDCAACHGEQGWKPSTFSVAEHAKSAYPLEGKHAGVTCLACHPRNPSNVDPARLGRAGILIRRAHQRCTDCHAEAHAGQLAHREDRGTCESCHSVQGWQPSLYTVADHRALSFILDGKHAETACAACHGPERKGLPALPGREILGEARVAMSSIEKACAGCHRDPHEGRFAAAAGKGAGAGMNAGGCLDCHDTTRFSPSTMDPAIHDRSSFPLEGAHRAAPCTLCHRTLEAPPATSSLLLASTGGRSLEFREKAGRCEDCHDDPHRGQFANRVEYAGCKSCHDTEGFRPATLFDHERSTTFPLKGAHARVACAKCHEPVSTADGRSTITYRPTPTKCEACHGGRRPVSSASIGGSP